MIEKIIQSSITTKEKLLNNKQAIETIQKVADEMVACYKNEGKILLCGNGGSAADAQHIAAELSGRFYLDRKSLAAEALHVNSSYITAVANDYSFEDIYARYTEGVAKKGDVFIGLSTSGNSENIIRALQVAKKNNMITIALTGESGGRMKDEVDYLINVPSSDTPRIQEAHIMIGHVLCEIVEKSLFSEER